MMTDEQRRKWKCSACGSSFAFYSGNPRFLAFCVGCVSKIRAHAVGSETLEGLAKEDTPESWAAVADDWLFGGKDLPESLTENDRKEFDAWVGGGPSTDGAKRYARNQVARRA